MEKPIQFKLFFYEVIVKMRYPKGITEAIEIVDFNFSTGGQELFEIVTRFEEKYPRDTYVTKVETVDSTELKRSHVLCEN